MNLEKKIVIKRHLNENWVNPISDIFEIDETPVLKQLKLNYSKILNYQTSI